MPAREVRVWYDEEQRPTSWRLDLTAPEARLAALVGTNAFADVGTDGATTVYRLDAGPIAGGLALRAGETVSLLSQAYVVNWQKDLLKFTRK